MRPAKHMHCCDGCDGAGKTQSEDSDEYGRHVVDVQCEVCDGHGELVDCIRCDEAISLPEADRSGGFCPTCILELEAATRQSDMERIRRRA